MFPAQHDAVVVGQRHAEHAVVQLGDLRECDVGRREPGLQVGQSFVHAVCSRFGDACGGGGLGQLGA
ncbi:hypothetical protein [Nonomuraea sp. NPDC052265]|uniref:hypothetical protein n=1 Tax=Nonomuraea sp. NPDC052265 TaxID=3364374 RepID=UPI0037C503FF